MLCEATATIRQQPHSFDWMRAHVQILNCRGQAFAAAFVLPTHTARATFFYAIGKVPKLAHDERCIPLRQWSYHEVHRLQKECSGG